jgi:hypothetical protein
MRTASDLVDVNVRGVARAFTHLVRWLNYHSVGDGGPSGGPAARLSFYSTSEPRARKNDVA